MWTGRPDLRRWEELVGTLRNPSNDVTIAMVGKYVDLTESYKSLIEALNHAGLHTRTKVNINYIDSEEIEAHGTESLKKLDAILVPGGFGKRGTEGKIKAIQYARENKVPYLGICLGMQLMCNSSEEGDTKGLGIFDTEVVNYKTVYL